MDGFVMDEPRLIRPTSNMSREKLSTMSIDKHQTVKALESPIPLQGVRGKSRWRCHLPTHVDLMEICHGQHKPISLTPGLKFAPACAMMISSHPA